MAVPSWVSALGHKQTARLLLLSSLRDNRDESIHFPFCFYLPGKAVVYLVAFHLFFVMFVWSYWMTIFTSPASPSKEVNLMLVNYQMLSLMMGLFSLCYLC